jgi:hypothetical protein
MSTRLQVHFWADAGCGHANANAGFTAALVGAIQ